MYPREAQPLPSVARILTTRYRIANMTGKSYRTKLRGINLIEDPLLNKGTAFSIRERSDLGLHGLLPPHVATIEEQVEHMYQVFCAKKTPLEKHTFLRNIQDENETLFYNLLQSHIEEMTPIVYTPVVGEACQQFGKIYRRPRGLYVSYPNRDAIDEIVGNIHSDQVDVIVVTDGQRILGLGDQGAGGMGIPIGKLSLYSLCGGIDPARTLPVLLDLGTNNEERLADPTYLGWRHRRISGDEYENFVELFVQAVMRRFPNVLLQWEDFASEYADILLERYQHRLCTFNDDIQGTAASTVGTLLSAVGVTGQPLEDHRFVMLGAGSAGYGNHQLLVRCLVDRGLSEQDARDRIFVLDSRGLLHDGRDDMSRIKRKMCHSSALLEEWGLSETPDLDAVVRHARPTALIGATGRPGAFPEAIVREMAEYATHPIFLPLSNPTSRAEATPKDLLEWTGGRALIATGSPFGTVQHDGQSYVISQSNNVYIFPAIGLAVLAVRAQRVTEEMFLAAALALGAASPAGESHRAGLLPPLANIRQLAKQVALAVAKKAIEQGIADRLSCDEIERRIDDTMWSPVYRDWVAD
ncbi:MAG: malate dehydrogenase (oxaloacetate-decarboxylating) [Planctomycetota bacterium]|jgi:malate dehydrogenase (oxaloacetate-decarboxylating)